MANIYIYIYCRIYYIYIPLEDQVCCFCLKERVEACRENGIQSPYCCLKYSKYAKYGYIATTSYLLFSQDPIIIYPTFLFQPYPVAIKASFFQEMLGCICRANSRADGQQGDNLAMQFTVFTGSTCPPTVKRWLDIEMP